VLCPKLVNKQAEAMAAFVCRAECYLQSVLEREFKHDSLQIAATLLGEDY